MSERESDPNPKPPIAISAEALGDEEKTFFQALNTSLLEDAREKGIDLSTPDRNTLLANHVADIILAMACVVSHKAKIALPANAVEDYINFQHNKHEAHARLIADISELNIQTTLDHRKLKAAFTHYFNTVHADIPSRKFALKTMDEELEECVEHSLRVRKLVREGFFDEWAAGKFTYAQPYFQNEADAAHFMSRWSQRLGQIADDGLIKLYDRSIHTQSLGYRVANCLVQRVIAHERPMWQRKAELEQHMREEFERSKQVEKQKQRQEEQEANELKERQRLQDFMASPQPYQLDGSAGHVLDQCMQAGKSKIQKAKAVQGIVDGACAQLDVRDPDVEACGDVLFSQNNLMRLARAFDLEAQMKSITPLASLSFNARTKQLRTVYEKSTNVQSLVNTLLEDHNSILLLATLVRDEARYKEYAHYLQAQNQIIASLLTPFLEAGFSYEDIEELERLGDQEVCAMRASQKKIGEDIAKAQAALADEIRQVFDGIKPRDVQSAEVRVASQEPSPPQDPLDSVPQEKRPAWKKALSEEFPPHEFYIDSCDTSAKSFTLRSRTHPYIYKDIKRDASLETLRSTINEVYFQLEIYLGKEEKIKGDCGFDITADAYVHREYGINVPRKKEAVSLQEREAELQECASLFNDIMAQQISLLQSCNRAKVMVESVNEQMRGSGPITLWFPDLSRKSFSERGFFTPEDFSEVQTILNHLIPREPVPIRLADVEAQFKPTRHTTIHNWKPQPGQTVMLFDTNVLKKLSARRHAGLLFNKNNRTWLDIPKHSARLPNICPLITSSVFDFESCGQIVNYDAEGQRTFQLIHEGYEIYPYLIHMKKVMEELATAASRAVMADDGSITYERRDNTNFAIIETPVCRALYALIRDIESGPEREKRRRYANEVYGRDMGEKSITCFLRHVRARNSALIVSDDTTYLDMAAPRTTGMGAPVMQATLFKYLDAELFARDVALNNELGEDCVLSMHYICQSIREFWAHKERNNAISFPGRSRRGESPTSHTTPPNIFELIRAGVEQQAAQAKPATSPHNGASHNGITLFAKPLLQPTITPRAINAAEVHNRPGDSKEIRGA